MPIYRSIKANEHTAVYVWKIEESLDELRKGLTLNNRSIERLEGMRSELHQKGFLSVRKL